MHIGTLESIMTMFVKFFPHFKFDFNDDIQVQLWLGELAYMEDQKAVLAARKVISTCDFVTVKNMKQAYAEMTMPTPVDDEEGWGLVKKAIRQYGYMRSAEAMNSLPSQVQKAVMYCGGFQSICESEREEVMRGQFNKAMAAVNTKCKSQAALGTDLLSSIQSLQLDAEKREHQLLDIDMTPKIEQNKQTSDKYVADKIQSIKEIIMSERDRA